MLACETLLSRRNYHLNYHNSRFRLYLFWNPITCFFTSKSYDTFPIKGHMTIKSPKVKSKLIISRHNFQPTHILHRTVVFSTHLNFSSTVLGVIGVVTTTFHPRIILFCKCNSLGRNIQGHHDTKQQHENSLGCTRWRWANILSMIN
jgi:hypothetical protein